MAIASGTRLGPYEVLGPLGAGGTGEVYRARDARLGRDIALKVLPEAVSSSPDRLARLEREAAVTEQNGFADFLQTSPYLRELHMEPRWLELLRKLGFDAGGPPAAT